MRCVVLHCFVFFLVFALFCDRVAVGQILVGDGEVKILVSNVYNVIMDLQKKVEGLQESIGSLKSTCKEEMTGFKEFLLTDECSEETHNCSEWATCEDVLASFLCTCVPGYTGDGYTCTDINECEENPNLCGTNERCVNTEGSFECQCQDGYAREGSECLDRDECQEGLSECQEPLTCVNKEGSYECQCLQPNGWRGDVCVNSCVHPSLYIETLGCITPILRLVPWEEARGLCQGKDMRLLEDIRKEHFKPISSHFLDIFSGYPYPWVGFKENKWITSSSPVSKELLAKEEGELDGTCGFFDLRDQKIGLWDGNCSYVEYPLCQPIP